MSVLTIHEKDGYLDLDEEECRAAGKARAESYQQAQPFPHIVIDDLFDPAALRDFLPGFPATEGKQYFDRSQERLKFQFPAHEIPGAQLRNLVTELNGQAFLTLLEEMTGIEGLIPDPYYSGGGVHETKAGGHLGVHADFNIHGKLNVERRLNLLIYLNDDWPVEYGGNLELWDKQMHACQVSVAPVIGRAVVFNTSLDSYHGQPDPVACPPDRARRSIATYYYTARAEGLVGIPHRTTNFRARPGTEDRADRRVALDHFIRDWVPPKLQRFASRFNRFQ